MLGRLQGGKLLLDVRTVFSEQEAALALCVIDAARCAVNWSGRTNECLTRTNFCP